MISKSIVCTLMAAKSEVGYADFPTRIETSCVGDVGDRIFSAVQAVVSRYELSRLDS